MPYAAVLRGCLRIRLRLIMSVVPSAAAILRFPMAPRSPSSTTPRPAAPMKSNSASGGVYVPPIPRLRSVIASANGNLAAARSVDYDWRDSSAGAGQGGIAVDPPAGAFPPYFRQQSFPYSRYAYDDYSDDDSDRDVEVLPASNKVASTLDNVDEWRWKLSMLLRNESEQEVVSRERKDRRDYDQLSALAERMGLYSRQYGKVVVFSKVPLPNYRSNLDDKRPQREVSIPIGLLREVDHLLEDYLIRKRTNRESFPNTAFSRSSSTDSFATDEGLSEQQDPQSSASVVMEKILRRRSLQLRNQQQAWQVQVSCA